MGKKPQTEPPVTHSVSPDWARETFTHREMVALSGMFRRWALYEPDVTPERATRFIQWSSDYERLANWLGADWEPEGRSDPMPLTKFLAQQEIRSSRVIPLEEARALLSEISPPCSTAPQFSKADKDASGQPFDEELYAKAIPFLKAGMAHFKGTGQDLAVVVRTLVQCLAGRGMDQETIERMAPYLRRFLDDIRSGRLEIDGD